MHSIGDDNELDRLSREASGRYPSPGNPDWESLRAELDKVLPVEEEKKRRVIFFWWLLPVLLIGGGAAYWLSSAKPDAIHNALKEAITQENINAVTAKHETAVNKQTAKSTIPITGKEKDLTGTGSLIINGGRKATATFTNDEPKTDGVVSALTMHPTMDKEPVKESAGINNAVPPVQETTQPAKENKAQPEPSPVKENTNEAISIQPSKEKPRTTRGKGWSYGLMAGVDQSTVKFKYQDNAGFNFGAMVGYHFNDRISIHTGAIFTQKNYKVAGEDFTAPKGSWASYYKIDNVDGFCRMWEVPLLLRYTLSRSAKNQFFLSTGLSSYFMTKENYDYYYYNNAGLLATRHYEYDSRDTHVMSIAHFSAGFEKPISKSWSIMVEPYAKVPLAGVGLGSIHLSSFGLNLSVQHRQPSKK